MGDELANLLSRDAIGEGQLDVSREQAAPIPLA